MIYSKRQRKKKDSNSQKNCAIKLKLYLSFSYRWYIIPLSYANFVCYSCSTICNIITETFEQDARIVKVDERLNDIK